MVSSSICIGPIDKYVHKQASSQALEENQLHPLDSYQKEPCKHCSLLNMLNIFSPSAWFRRFFDGRCAAFSRGCSPSSDIEWWFVAAINMKKKSWNNFNCIAVAMKVFFLCSLCVPFFPRLFYVPLPLPLLFFETVIVVQFE